MKPSYNLFLSEEAEAGRPPARPAEPAQRPRRVRASDRPHTHAQRQRQPVAAPRGPRRYVSYHRMIGVRYAKLADHWARRHAQAESAESREYIVGKIRTLREREAWHFAQWRAGGPEPDEVAALANQAYALFARAKGVEDSETRRALVVEAGHLLHRAGVLLQRHRARAAAEGGER